MSDKDNGPIVRPYAMTAGRTRPVKGDFDLFSMIVAVGGPALDGRPESELILRYCVNPVSVAELAAHLDLPAGTVKVLLGDLLARQLIETRSSRHIMHTQPILEAVIHGLRAL